MSQKNHSQLSPFHYSLCLPSDHLNQYSPSRQRKEYKVFQQLLKMVHLREHLMETSDEECMMMADLVGVSVSESLSNCHNIALSIEDSEGHSERKIR